MNHLTPPRNGVPAGLGYPPTLARLAAPCALRQSPKPGDGIALSVTGELDLETRTALREAMEQAVTSCTGEVSLALSECTFMDASTLGVIIDQAAELEVRGRRLTIEGYSREVAAFLRAAGMDGCDLITFLPELLAEGVPVSFADYQVETMRKSEPREAWPASARQFAAPGGRTRPRGELPPTAA